MTLALALGLGLLQGLTEFLPVSSSGHLRLLGAWFGLEEPLTLFDLVLHLGSLVAILLVYRQLFGRMLRGSWRLATAGRRRAEVWGDEPEARLAAYAIAGTVPTGLIGVVFGDLMEGLAAQVAFVGAALIANAGLLFGMGVLQRRGTRPGAAPRRGLEDLRLRDVLTVGLIQGIGIFRGVSRSGTTITAGLLVGLRPDAAAALSFVMSVPAILGAFVLKLSAAGAGDVPAAAMAVGAVTSAVVGTLALLGLLRLLGGGKLHYFAWYCLAVGTAALVWSLTGSGHG